MTRRSVLAWAVPGLLILLLTVLVTWPQARHMSTRIGAHDDPMFSIWRLAWVSHALAIDPRHLLDGNIFHPAAGTLTFSDAMLLEGLVAAPFFWLGISPVLIYNVLLLAGFVASGLAMFVLARHLAGASGPAFVAAAIFTMAPYRVEHFMHLELQWAMWMPLAFWAIHRAVQDRSWRYGVLAGLFLWLQILSSVYYGVFLAIACGMLVLLLLVTEPVATRRALPALALGGLAAAVLAVPYALPYLRTARTMTRGAAEVATYSATVWSYLASPPQSYWWWWTGDRFGGVELSLFPGAVALALALAAAFSRLRARVVVYAVLTLVVVELSRGLNGRLYAWLFNSVGALHGLRSPSRFGVVACATIAVLAGLGAQAIGERLARFGGRPVAVAMAALALMVAADNATRGMILFEVPYQTSSTFNVYKTIRALGPGPVLELPLPRLDRLPGHEATFMLWSTTHWHPLVNGYSGYYPPEYAESVVRLEHFPDDQSIAQLTSIGVRYIVVHRVYYDEPEFESLMGKMAARPELRARGECKDPLGECRLFELGP